MHDNGKLTRDRNSSALEADLLLELETPGTQRAVSHGTRQDHGGRFIQQSAQMIVAAPGYMSVVIDLTRLVASGGQADPGAN